MKHIRLLLFAAWMVCAEAAEGQDKEMRLGSRFSIGQSELTGGFGGRSPGLMFGVGGSADYMLNKYIGLMGDAMFVQHAVQYEGRSNGGIFGQSGPYEYTERMRFYRAEFPVMAKIRLGSENIAFRGYAGPRFGFHLLGLRSREYRDRNFDEDYGYENQRIREMYVMNLGVDCGIGIEIKGRNNEMFFADLRTGNSMNSMGRVDGQSILIRNFCISAGYVF